MKTYIIYYKGRGAEFKFQSPFTKFVTASNAREARSRFTSWMGDVYKIVKVVESVRA